MRIWNDSQERIPVVSHSAALPGLFHLSSVRYDLNLSFCSSFFIPGSAIIASRRKDSGWLVHEKKIE